MDTIMLSEYLRRLFVISAILFQLNILFQRNYLRFKRNFFVSNEAKWGSFLGGRFFFINDVHRLFYLIFQGLQVINLTKVKDIYGWSTSMSLKDQVK